ncbi:hypothetical protein Patl1_32420 [Pistacia atlantica]|uniref:Uncharacterized protein n=1 Tax=Pistacia atlantica TaxID=434234 RepID=A0ACC1APX2_9ROSI|nr:hypothetical protein Patl1_32420 [Pistacia atlantica]
MGSFPGTCEIVEAGEEVNSIQHSRRTCRPNSGSTVVDNDRKLPVLKLAYKDSLEDDINQLFEAISLRTSSKGSGFSPDVGTSASPLRKNALKKPISVPQSPRIGTSEPVSLKQALRELCITKASEMAAMKRLSKSSSSPGVSEAVRIKSLYNAKVVEAASGSGHLADEGKGSMLEISLVPEDSPSTSARMVPQAAQLPKIKTSNQSAHPSPRLTVPTMQKATGNTQSAHSSPRVAVPTRQIATVANQSAHSSPWSAVLTVRNATGTNYGAQSSPRFAILTTNNGIGTNQTAHSPRFAIPTKNSPKTTLMQDEVVPASKKFGTQAIKTEIAQKEKHTPESSLSSSTVDMPESEKKVTGPTRSANRASAVKSGRKSRLQVVPSSGSINGSRVSKLTRNTTRMAKPVLRNKSSIKKKAKQDSTSVALSSNTYNEVKRGLDPSTTQLVCQRCQCALKNASNLADQDSSASNMAGITAEVCSTNADTFTSELDFAVDNCNGSNAVVKAKKNTKSREKGEFSQSSKSSLGEYSSSTSNSDDSNLSSSSCGNRPHMSKDVRWEAIRHVRVQHGTLGLRHFNLLQKLGCGDIGTVYLAELIGTNCLFAIKVMDNDFLARRKKMPRAQTEREILRMLDHPFLPTLYAQFTSDNLSCLVMEYCPGGDLHVLRQKQLGRSFPEPAARFIHLYWMIQISLLQSFVEARDLIRGLLVKEPENRLGSQKGAAEIKQHPFFEGLNWALIRCAIPPELPEFYDYGVPSFVSEKSKYLECNATGELLEFELF